jgi:hypothetical protein
MKRQSLSLLLSTLLLTACGGGAMNTAYAPYGQAGYGQQAYGQTAYGGQAAYQPGYASSVYGQTGAVGYADPNQQAMAGYGAIPQQSMTGYPAQQSNLNGYAAAPTTQNPANTSYAATSPTRAPATTTKTSTSTKTAVPAKTSTAAKSTTATKTTATKTTPAVSQVSQFLSNARQAIDKLQTMSATMTNFEKGAQPGQAKIQFYYRKPGQVKIDVLQSSDASRKGVKLSFQSGSDQVRVRASGLLSLVPITLSMSDSKVKSGRGYLLSEIDFANTVMRLTQPSVQARVLGKMTQNGAEVIVLEIKTQNHFDHRITKEHLGLDSKTWLPRLHEMYEGTELVYSAKLETLEVNPSLASNAFDI